MRENCKSSTQPHSSCSLRGAGGALFLPYPSPCSTVVFSLGGGLSGSRPPGPIAGTILAQRAELGSALVRLVHVSAHCWLGRARDRAACCLPTCCFPWKSNLKILPMCRAWEQFALPFGVNVFMTCCRDRLVCHLLTQHLLATSPPLMFSHFSFERCLDGRFTPPTTSWVASR